MAQPLHLTSARLIDGTGAPPLDGVTVVVEDGRIVEIDPSAGPLSADAAAIDLAGRTLMPGLVDAHVHVTAFDMPEARKGQQAIAPEVKHHLIAQGLRRMLRMGITTVRDVGAFGDDLLHARQAVRLGAIPAPRILACGRIVSATSAGGRHFGDMYREADGRDEMRKATREQFRRGADFIKIMTTGARSCELEDSSPLADDPRGDRDGGGRGTPDGLPGGRPLRGPRRQPRGNRGGRGHDRARLGAPPRPRAA